MKQGKVIKNAHANVSEKQLELINQYTRRTLCKDEVYVFSVVLCDNDIDRDFERFTVESLFELEKLFVGKTGIFDHENSAMNQQARIFSTKVEALSTKKTATGDEYFRLVGMAYMPVCEQTKELITKIDCGIIKEVSVGCAVKETLCSICSNDMHSTSCNHTKGNTYNNKLCYGELCSVYDAYEFSFVAVPAQKNAGVLKNFLQDKKENMNMKNFICDLKKSKELSLDKADTKKLFEYISELELKAQDAQIYKDELTNEVVKHMGLSNPSLSIDTIKGITKKLCVSELKELCDAYKKKEAVICDMTPQLSCIKNTTDNHIKGKNHFTI